MLEFGGIAKKIARESTDSFRDSQPADWHRSLRIERFYSSCTCLRRLPAKGRTNLGPTTTVIKTDQSE